MSDLPLFKHRVLYLRIFARQRRRDLSRRILNLSVESAYEELLPIDPRTNALYGEHLRSNTQDRIIEGSGNLDGALEELRKFKIFYTFRTIIEEQEKDYYLFIKGKIHH